MYPKTRQGILGALQGAIYETGFCRWIARKGLGVLPESSGLFPTNTPPDPWATYAQIDEAAGTHSALGSVVSYEAGDGDFPDGTVRFSKFGDFKGVDEARLLATVTGAYPVGSTLALHLYTEAGEVAFATANPRVPLDEVGVQISDYEGIDWGPDPLNDNEELPAWARFYVEDATGSGSAGVGLCQLQVRGDLDS